MTIEIDPESTAIRETRTFTRSGDSTVLSIPPEILETLDFQSGQEVEIEGDWGTGEITIRRVEDEE